MSNMPKPTVASNVSRAKVSKSVMKQSPLSRKASGVHKNSASPTPGRKGEQTACRMWTAFSSSSITDVSTFFNGSGRLFGFRTVDTHPKKGYTGPQNKNHAVFARQKGTFVENFNELLKKYADFIVRVGVNPQPGQTLIINCSLEAAPLARLCVRSAYEAGARDVQVNWKDNTVSRTQMELGSEEALCDNKPWQLRRYLDYAESEGGVCVLHLIADDPEVYAGLDGAKISRVNAAARKFMAPWREYTMNDKVQWSIAAMPSAPWAKKMFPELDTAAAIEKLWQLIFDVCRVTGGDPVNEWKTHLDRLMTLRDKMNAFDLESVHFKSSNGTDLTVGLADKASWESAGSKNEKGVDFLPNIPTEEVFTAPHKDKVDGIVYGTKPYVFNGQLIKGFHVTFKDGKVIEHGAEEGADLLGRLLDTDEGSRHIGEVALVPASSPINRSGALFYSTLFDENAACHIAFGASYPGTTENGTRLTKEQLLARGMNQSAIHEDVMIGAEDSEITGKCRDGRTVELFKNGIWVL